jgi:hypothetical protein
MFNKFWKGKHEYFGRCFYALAVLDAGVKVGLQVNAERTEYIFMAHWQNAGENIM